MLDRSEMPVYSVFCTTRPPAAIDLSMHAGAAAGGLFLLTLTGASSSPPKMLMDCLPPGGA